MKIPKLHSDELNEIVNDIASIDDSTVKMFKELNDAVKARAKEACKEIDGVISDIKEILEANESYKMSIVLGGRKFILHNSIEYVYIAIIKEETDDVLSQWPPRDCAKLDGAKNLIPITSKNDALENVAKLEYLEEQARFGKEMLKDFLSSYREYVGNQRRNFTTFIKNTHLESERKPKK